MERIVILLILVLAATAHPIDNGKKNGKENGKKPVHGAVIYPWIPFPHLDGIVLYEIAGDKPLTLLPGSAFVELRADGTCHRVHLEDEAGGECPLNQTICDQIASAKCEPAVANVTCFLAPKPGDVIPAGQPIDVPKGEFGNGYPYGGPLCHVEALGRQFQPSTHTALFTLAPTVGTCVFQVAPPPTVWPEPTGEPVLVEDPLCPYVEQ